MIELFLASFLFIAAKATQQLNVMHDRYCWVLPTSAFMALLEVFMIVSVVKTGMLSAVPLALGGGTGCMAAMWLHRRARGEN